MSLYIRSTGAISPQRTFGAGPLPDEPIEYSTNRLQAFEPDYKNQIDPKQIRRMSRIIKMGVAAANECLQSGAVKMPDAIITGTAYGCLEDTGSFLSKLVEHKEEMLSPTSFIQSTHNTVGAQIALILHCHQYNNTFVHRGFSFESALLDALLFAKENPAAYILAGAAEEITDISHDLLTRLGFYKPNPVSNFNLFETGTKGTIAGEGAAFFLLTAQNEPQNMALLEGFETRYKPGNFNAIEDYIIGFMKEHSLEAGDIDLVIYGRNGHQQGDSVYDQVEQLIFNRNLSVNYKNLCGEYPTATSFALWLASKIIQTGKLPGVLKANVPEGEKYKRILIYNHYQQIHHSLFLVAAC